MTAAPTKTAANWGLIAGNGRFPFLVLEAARSQGIDMAVIALREEASPELAELASRLHWVSLGELSRTIDLLHQEGVTHAVMAGQVKHNKIFSAIRPDWKLAKLLFSLPRKNTDSLIGAVARVLEDEGIKLVDSTSFLRPLLPEPGVLTRRSPTAHEAGLARGSGLVVVKVSKPKQDMRFDVPVVGLQTVEAMKRAGATALAVEAGRTLLFDRAKLIEVAAAAGIAIEAFAAFASGEAANVSDDSVEGEQGLKVKKV
jgi:DUF1009 family protein